jgi:hypothetical protein
VRSSKNLEHDAVKKGFFLGGGAVLNFFDVAIEQQLEFKRKSRYLDSLDFSCKGIYRLKNNLDN